ncbi:fimbrial biogenesis chaperone [Pseudoalteromonas lipolytica]|uniref:Fimbria/pilus periplasmic chaperone n=1 Tax=Pseudoalteromonas lipolytica TaxID=570156 RepID=A0ABU8SZ08_9GAMM
MYVSFIRAICVGLLFCLCHKVMANVVISGTRVIYPAQSNEVTLQLENLGKSPSLVQAWIDSGDANQTADSSDAPFFLTPPVSRVEPGRSQTLRIFFNGSPLTTTQESLFWLNVLDIPPSPDASTGTDRNYLQIAFRSRIKLFYRPSELSGNAKDAPNSLRWKLIGNSLQVENPSEYHVTLEGIRTVSGNEEVSIEDKGVMIAPREKMEFIAPKAAERLLFLSVNDFGGRDEHSVRLVDIQS